MPQRIGELDKEYLDRIISFYLLFSPDYIEKRFESEIMRHKHVIEARGDGGDTKEEYLRRNERLKNEYEKNNAQIFEIEGDYESETARIFSWLDEKI